jgi:hypothetical protein
MSNNFRIFKGGIRIENCFTSYLYPEAIGMWRGGTKRGWEGEGGVQRLGICQGDFYQVLRVGGDREHGSAGRG